MKHIRLINFILFVILSTTVKAQNKFSAEFKPNIDFATERFGEFKLKTGNGFEINIAHRLYKSLNGYAGVNWNLFNIDTEVKSELEVKGYSFGFLLIYPFNESSKLSYLFRFGGTYSKISVEEFNNTILLETKHKPGLEIVAGIEYCFLANWTLRPQLSYRTLSQDINVLNSKKKFTLNYINFGLGLSTTF